MTTWIKKHRVQWLSIRYPEHVKMLRDDFTLAELVERFFDSVSGSDVISRAFSPDSEDVEQIDEALLLYLWWFNDVEQSVIEIIVNWLSEFRHGTKH